MSAEPRGPERTQILRFCTIFLVVAGTLSLLYAYSYPRESWAGQCFQRYLDGYAHAAGVLLSWFEPAVRVSGSNINGRFPLLIVKDCDAMEVKILFAAAVVAFPSAWWRRVVGALLGIAILFVANLMRIASLYFVGVHAPGLFESAHREIFPLILVALASGLFLVWVRWATAAPGVAAAEGVGSAR